MEQLPITELFSEQVTKSQFYLLTAVLHVDGGLAFGGYEWHEKYIAKMPGAEVSDNDLLQAMVKIHAFSKAIIIQTGGGPRLKVGNATIFFTRLKVAPMLAKQIIEHKILMLLNIEKHLESAA